MLLKPGSGLTESLLMKYCAKYHFTWCSDHENVNFLDLIVAVSKSSFILLLVVTAVVIIVRLFRTQLITFVSVYIQISAFSVPE